MPEIGQTVSHFRILEKIAGGGMGVVYRAEDTNLNRQVAIKVPHRQIVGSSEEQESYLDEARVVAALDHRARDGRPHHGGAQREEVHPGLHHGEHGGPQAGGVRDDPHLQGAFRRRQGQESQGLKAGEAERWCHRRGCAT